MVFITLNLIVSKNISEFINFAVFNLFCLIETEPYYGLVPYLSTNVRFIFVQFQFYLDFVIKFFQTDIKFWIYLIFIAVV